MGGLPLGTSGAAEPEPRAQFRPSLSWRLFSPRKRSYRKITVWWVLGLLALWLIAIALMPANGDKAGISIGNVLGLPLHVCVSETVAGWALIDGRIGTALERRRLVRIPFKHSFPLCVRDGRGKRMTRPSCEVLCTRRMIGAVIL